MVNSIMKTFDIWTDAQGVKSKGRVKSVENINLEGIASLRILVLDLAVLGKLIKQNPNDEAASLLLEKITNEKEKLLREGTLKRERISISANTDSLLSTLPKGWVWCRISDIGAAVNNAIVDGPFGSNLVKSDYDISGDYPVISISNIDNGFELSKLPKINANKFNELKRSSVNGGDILVAKIGSSYGKVGIYPEEMPVGIIPANLLKITANRFVDKAYAVIFLRSQLLKSQLDNIVKSTAQPAFNVSAFRNLFFPLPPLAEQKRIVAKVDELMSLCDKLEQEKTTSLKTHQTLVAALLQTLTAAKDAREVQVAWNRLVPHFDTLFCTEDSIDQLKQTILQLAIMGRLVKQDPAIEPASELLKKIEKEKEKLIKDGKIKREKPLPEIKDTEKLFVLPDGWDLSRLGTFTFVGTGSTPSRDKFNYYNPAEINWVTSGETSQDFIYGTNEKISPLALTETNISIYPKGSLIVAMYGQGKTRGQVSELMIDAGTNQACAAIVLIEKNMSHRKYLKYFFKKAYEEIRSHAAGGAQPNLNLGKVANTVIPLPPLVEQERIVAKLDELMALCDNLKERLLKSQEIQNTLSKTIVENAVA